MNKKSSLLLFFIKMALVGTIILFISTLIPNIITGSLLTSKYGYEAIVELIMALIVLVVILRYGNGYIFTEKGEKFRKCIFIGGPMFVVALISFISNLPIAMEAPLGNIVNVFILCFAIGLFEELLCRGWIQNEFIERYGDSRKGVIISILCASLIFGAFHFTNLFGGQPLLETTLQVLQATSSGFLLGAIFFRTKNIWSTIFLHGFYDLAIYLGEVNLYKDCTTMANPGMEVMFYQYAISLLIIAIYFLTGFFILRKEKTDHLIEQQYKEPTVKEKRNNNIIKLAIIALSLILFLPAPIDVEDTEVCYTYGEVNYKEAYELHYSHYDKYEIDKTIDGKKYELYFHINEDNNLVLDNKIINNTIVLAEDIYSFEIIENEDYFILVIDDGEDILYIKDNYVSFDNTNNYLLDYKNKIEKLDLPFVMEIGYITVDKVEDKKPIVKTDLNDIFVIEAKDNIKVIK